MKIKCKICNTVYDNKEKYCPYCFNRTVRNHDCYNLDSEIVYSKDKYRQPDKMIYEGSAIQKQKARQSSFNYQQRSTSKYKQNRKMSPAATISTVFLIMFVMVFISMFLMIFLNIIFLF